jgi:hypothetical protein
MADEKHPPNPILPTEKKEPTPQELADQFATLALKVALAPEPDGLDVLKNLMAKPVRRQS